MWILECYSMGDFPEEMPDLGELYRIFERHEGRISFESTDDFARMLFEENFVSLASIERDGTISLAFSVYLESYKEGVLIPEKDGRVESKNAALQLLYQHDAYVLAYPETNISAYEDMAIITSPEDAIIVFEAWREGIPYVDDSLTETIVFDQESGESHKKSDFNEDMT